MDANWTIVAVISIFVIALIAYLIYKNQADEKDVTTYFDENEKNSFPEDDREPNDQR